MIKLNKELYKVGGRGNFSMKFANGYTVSLAMGDGTYSNGNLSTGFTSVEVGVWDANGDWFPLTENDVRGWVTADGVLGIMNQVASLQPIDS
jgi:ATP-dependent DNA ligase